MSKAWMIKMKREWRKTSIHRVVRMYMERQERNKGTTAYPNLDNEVVAMFAAARCLRAVRGT